MHEAMEQFRDAIRSAGLTPPEIIDPGRLHRFSTNGKRSDDAGWCKLFPDLLGGVFGDHRSGIYQVWHAKRDKPFTEAELKAFKERCKKEKKARQADLNRQSQKARMEAKLTWRGAQPETGQHRYLSDKGVNAYGIRCDGQRLVVPMRDTDGTLHSLQFIDPNGDKRYLKDGRVAGCYHAIGKPNGTLCIAEGYATAASIHEATAHAVAVAFNAGNLKRVAEALREKYPDLQLILCADNDIKPDGENVGLNEAAAAAQAVGALLAVPEMDGRKCDFNDLHRERGADAVKQAIEAARPPTDANFSNFSVSKWPEPQSLIEPTVSAPYPVGLLPAGIHEAVSEVAGFVQCPVALAACSALSALSMVGQGLADVRRADRLSGPCSLYLLAVADSGERKTTCDNFFAGAILEWEREQAARMEPEVSRYAAAMRGWEAKREGVLQAIKTLSKAGKSTFEKEGELERLEADKPRPPRVPSLIYGDTTPEALAFNLAHSWPSGGVLSSEAGIVFGGHGMGRESITRNLALLNSLWDGRGHKVHRRTSESFTVDGVRLTMGLAVQPETVRTFFENSKGLARGSGFAARFLIAWPQSTQGERPFRAAPESWPHLSAFHRRIGALLDQAPTINEYGALELPMLDLSPDAKAAWIHFHDEVERELLPGGDMAETRDVASKAADNAARMAALFHIYEHGASGEISAEHLQAASLIVTWHLYEARRFLGELGLPPTVDNAAKLDAWLIRRCRETQRTALNAGHVLQFGPLRDKRARDEAIDTLAEAGRARLAKDGNRLMIEINPALLEVN